MHKLDAISISVVCRTAWFQLDVMQDAHSVIVVDSMQLTPH